MVSPGSVSFPALGTTASVVTADVADLLAAVAVVRTEIDAIDRACSRFRCDSDLMRLHATPDRWTRVDPGLFEAVEVALGAARATGGLVDPTVGEAVVRAGYDRDFAEVSQTGPPIEAIPAPGWRTVGMDAELCAIRLPTGVLLDLGATAKALAADRAAANAAEATGGGVLVSLGGDLAAFGPPPAGGGPSRSRTTTRTRSRGRSSASRAEASRRRARPSGGGSGAACPCITSSTRGPADPRPRCGGPSRSPPRGAWTRTRRRRPRWSSGRMPSPGSVRSASRRVWCDPTGG